MKSRGWTLLEAGEFVKRRWDATWPCDRFVLQLMEYERELSDAPKRMFDTGLTFAAGIAAGALLVVALRARGG